MNPLEIENNLKISVKELKTKNENKSIQVKRLH